MEEAQSDYRHLCKKLGTHLKSTKTFNYRHEHQAINYVLRCSARRCNVSTELLLAQVLNNKFYVPMQYTGMFF